MSATLRAFAALMCAFAIWGLFPIFVRLMSAMRADELLYVRVVFSLLCLLVFFSARQALGEVLRHVLQKRFLLRAACTAVFLALNWYLYIVAVNWHQTLQASIGYFITPLINVAFGYLVFKEKLDKWTQLALCFGIAGVICQMTLIQGSPWIAIAIGGSWGCYGGLRKALQLPPMQGLLAEMIILCPFALFLWGQLGLSGNAFPYLERPWMIFMALMAGVITLVPLLCFLYAVPKLNMSTIALGQYLTPTLQFLIALLYFHEPFNLQRFIAFLLIWIGLGIYSVHLLSYRRKTT